MECSPISLHTHKPWVHEHGGVLFVNCGAVGKPKDGDPRASFAVLEDRNGGVSVSIERADYDARTVAAKCEPSACPKNSPRT
jgi:predicted phosphodiesterase